MIEAIAILLVCQLAGETLALGLVAGTFAGIAMGLNAVLTALIVPIILSWFIG